MIKNQTEKDRSYPPSIEPGQTLGSWVHDRLRDDIIEGTLKPGQRLTLNVLKKRYQVGITPLREALYRLSTSLLVTAEDQRGFRVASVSPEHRRDIITARQHIETLTLRDAFQHGDLEWDGRILAAFHRLKNTRMYADDATDTGRITHDWEAAHRQFHQTILSAAASSTLRHFQSILWDHAARYRNLNPPARQKGEALYPEHEALVDAILRRDEEMAYMLLRRHILGTASSVVGGSRTVPSAEPSD